MQAVQNENLKKKMLEQSDLISGILKEQKIQKDKESWSRWV